MTPATVEPKNASLLGNPTGEIVLRVRGTARDGQEIRLTGTRCSVGSAPGSTLRLVAKGVEPLHCFLLRGARGTQVRRIAAETWLNDVPFDNAPLHPGDRLKIGPLEFEVAGIPFAETPVAATPVAETPTTSVTGRQIEQEELRRRAAELKAERDQWESEAGALQRQCNDLRAELASEQALRELGRDALANARSAQESSNQERKAWELRLEADQRELARREEVLLEREAALSTAMNSLAEQRRSLEEQVRELTSGRDQLHLDQQQLTASFNDLNAQREALDSERKAHQEGSALEHRRLDELEARLTAERQDLDRALAELHAQQQSAAEAQRALEDQAQAIAAQQAEFAAQQADIAAQQAALARSQASLDSERTSLATAQAEWAQQQAQARAELDAEQQQLAAEREELFTQRRRIEEMPVLASAPHVPMEASASTPSVVEETPSAVEESGPGETAPADPPPMVPEPESLAARDNDEDVFARLRALSLLRESGDAPAVEDASQPPEPDLERPASSMPDDTPPAATTTAAPAGTPPHDSDESIDDYMAQLFARLNGSRSGTSPVASATTAATETSAAPPPSSSPPRSAVSRAEPIAPTVPNTAEPAAPCETETALSPLDSLSTPRRSAPEGQASLSAMRELANMSATSAIGASQRKRWTTSAAIKLAASAGLGVVGAGLLMLAKSGWLASSSVTLYGFGAVLFVAGILWFLQGFGLLVMAWRVHKPAVPVSVSSPSTPTKTESSLPDAAAQDSASAES